MVPSMKSLLASGTSVPSVDQKIIFRFTTRTIKATTSRKEIATTASRTCVFCVAPVTGAFMEGLKGGLANTLPAVGVEPRRGSITLMAIVWVVNGESITTREGKGRYSPSHDESRGQLVDELFFVDLPTAAERVDILNVVMRRYKRDATRFDLDQVAEKTPNFSGAELEAAWQNAMFRALTEDREETTDDIIYCAKEIVPLAHTMSEQIAESREWAQNRARPASSAARDAVTVTGRELL